MRVSQKFITSLIIISLVFSGTVSQTNGAVGDITDTVIETFEIDTDNGDHLNIINVSGNVFAVVYEGTDFDGFVKTITIGTDGDIAASVTDTLEFDTEQGDSPIIINVTGDIYAIVYMDSNDVDLVTIDIDSSGNIENSVVDSLEIDGTDSQTPYIIQVDTNTYAIAYNGPDGDGFVKTIDIDAAGDIAASVTDTFEFETSDTLRPEIIHVSGDVFAIAYQGVDGDGFVKTITIDSSGDIGASVTDTLEFETDHAEDVDIVNVSGEIFAIAYEGPDGGSAGDGFVKTVEINTDGTIEDSVIDTLEYNTTIGLKPSIASVGNNVFAITRIGVSEDGFVDTITINTDGTIDNSVIDTLEYNTSNADQSHLLKIGGDIFVIAYQGDSNDGFLTTIEIDAGPTYTRTATDTPTISDSSSVVETVPEGETATQAVPTAGTGNFQYSETEDATTDNISLAITLPTGVASNVSVQTIDENTVEDGVQLATAADITATCTNTCTIQFTVPNDVLTAAGLTSSSASIYHDTSGDEILQANEAITTTRDTTTTAGSTIFSGSASFTSKFAVGGVVGATSAQATAGAAAAFGLFGLLDSCDENGFGDGQSLMVYDIMYDKCTEGQVKIYADTTCGPMTVKIGDAYGVSIAGMSSTQPLLNNDTKKVIYNHPIESDIEWFSVIITDKKDEFTDKIYTNQCTGTMSFTGNTGYTSEQQGIQTNNEETSEDLENNSEQQETKKESNKETTEQEKESESVENSGTIDPESTEIMPEIDPEPTEIVVDPEPMDIPIWLQSISKLFEFFIR